MHLGTTGRQRGGQTRVGDRVGGHRNVYRVGQIHTPEHDARVGRGRPQGDLYPLAAVQAYAYSAGDGFEGSLFEHRGIVKAVRAPKGPHAKSTSG